MGYALWLRIGGGLVVLALTSCAATAPAPPAPPQEAAPPPQQTATTRPVSLLPQTLPPPAAAPPQRKKEDRKPVQTATAPMAPTPVQLVGMDESQLGQMFGQPAAVETHPPGKTLRYRRQECVLSLALFLDVETRIYRTLSYEVSSDDNNAGACRTRFGSLAASQ